MGKPVKHAAIIAHPNAQSFTAAVACAYGAAAQDQGHAVIVRDLYRMNFDPRLQSAELPFQPDFQPGADVVRERELLHDVDVFALFYPLWLGGMPAIMKGYLERIFGFGFAYGKNGRSEPLMGGRKLISFSSSGAPLYWLEETGAFGAIRKLFDDYFADACGLVVVDHQHFGGIVPGIRQDYVESRLAQVGDTVKRHFGRSQCH